MGIIKQLSETIINKIAAGEVVERPASIVKELIENSIDAGAKNIEVEIEGGGKKHILVRDDGCGMSEEDLFMALESHATSKLTKIEDLEDIATMGFRGEAVPSIAAVTKFSISSAQKHGNGFKIETKNNSVVRNMPVSMPKGTEIVADDIFFNVSARRKFLKEEKTEYGKIREIITNFAVAYYRTAFSFKSDSRIIFSYAAANSQLERISSVWKISKELIGSAEAAYQNTVSVHAFIPSPLESVPNHSVITVNGRIVSDRAVNSAIFSTFRDAVGGEFKSPVMLFIKTDPHFVDVNVHPAKLEVRFLNTSLVTSLIREAILKALQSIRNCRKNESSTDPIPQQNPLPKQVLQNFEYSNKNKNTEKPSFNALQEKNDGFIHGKITGKPASYAGFSGKVYEPLPKNYVNPFKIRENEPVYTPTRHENEIQEQAYIPEPEHGNLFGMKIRDYKKIGVVFGVYLVIEMEDKIVFLDQHAAHERITYTALQKAVSMNNGLSQELITPLLIRLSPTEAATLEENSEKFKKSGFVINMFDESSATLRAIPALGLETNWEKVIKEMLGELAAYSDSFELEKFFLSHLAQIACKASVRRNDILADEEIDVLIDAVNKSDFLSCPHGRPFFFVMTKNEFEKKVQRR
ncbi:DNA mismatch repair endonuclease MutL [bacterium]|nr:DNA mismatch repair endonuclease MutL [bacterium]